ncbi:MAG: hypothetical protein JRE28_15880 [Deltaproteobacteria bacterium]|nr:hypothetical protein [Deltaproteobacteria bacterium]
MKRIIRLMTLLFFMVCGLAFTTAADEDNVLSINAGADTLALSLTQEIATKYFDAKKRPVIKVAVFDFTDRNGDVTVGSRYISNRVKLAFGSSPQFALLSVQEFEKSGSLVYAEEFEKNNPLRERIVGEVKADVYIFGKIDTSGGASVACQVDLWGIKPPFDDFSNIGSLKELKETENGLTEQILSPIPWRGDLSSSGLDFFKHILVRASDQTSEVAARGNLGEVIFLSQPICDDLSLSWQVRADGMVYDVRQDIDTGTLRSRTGQIMQSRVKDVQTLKELSYIIRNFGFVVKETDGVANSFEAYMIPKGSDFYLVPYRPEGTGLRFMYLWAKRGRSKNPSAHETGKGWKLYVAERNYRNIMPVGTHTATATFEPIAESEYGTKKPRAEYVSRFKFSVKPGLNIYVINYVYRRDQPEIFVRRLEIEGSRDEPVKGVKKITEIYRVYGGE